MLSNENGLREIFAKMNRDGFDTEKVLKWGFFFVDKAKNNLLKIYKELEPHNYVIESLENTSDDFWQLYISRNEILTPEKLHSRNIAFNELAKHYNVALYDGWDVEKIEAL